MSLRGLVIGVLLVSPSIASAEVPLYGIVTTQRSNGIAMARQVLPVPDTVDFELATDEIGAAAVAQSRVIYLNKNGVTLLPGDNDSRTNRSTVVTTQTAFQGWNVSATNWQSTVSCVRELFAAYDVMIVDTDPGNVPHIEAVFGGTAQQVGMDANVAGVSPFTLDCSIIENSIVFAFTNGFTFTPREACEVMAQEIAHSFGLDHELLASDPMTYLPYNGNRAFRDQDASCGEDSSRPCGINGSVCRQSQNSVQLLRERLGLADAILPSLSFTSPPNNAVVPPGFQVKVSGSDNNAVTGAVLKIDGVESGQVTGAGPFVFTTSSSIAEGNHTIVVEVSDGKNIKSDMRTVTVMIGAPPPPDQVGQYDQEIAGGCVVGGGHGSALLGLGLWAALTARRRRRRR